MKYIIRFNESQSNNLLTEEDISDYLLEFIDNNSIEFSEINIRNDKDMCYLNIKYKINEIFGCIKDITTLERYNKFINGVTKIIKSWNLEFSIINKELLIIQKAPDIITKITNSPNKSVVEKIDKYTYELFPIWSNDKQSIIEVTNDMEFMIYFRLIFNSRVSTNNGFKYIETLNKNEDKIIMSIEKSYNCKFIEKIKIDNSAYHLPVHLDWKKQTFYKYKFKLNA